MPDHTPNDVVNDVVAVPKPNPSKEAAALVAFDKEKLFPKEAAERCGLDHQKMSVLEVPNGSTALYNAVLQYAAHFAVDLDADFETLKPVDEPSPEPEGKAKKTRTKVRTVKGIDGVSYPLREGPGELSSLWNCPLDRYDPLEATDSDSDTDSEDESEHAFFEGDDVGADEARERFASLLASYSSLGTLKKKIEPPVQRYQMGLGLAKIKVGDHIVFINHWGYGLPVSKSYAVEVFRSVVLGGYNPKAMQELCAVALKWRSDREQANMTPRPGRFTLFRYKTHAGQGDWCNQGYKRSRSPKSVILPDGQLEAIVKDIRDFVAKDTKMWYETHGLPHRRSYLFHGPPGCGKTSTIRMLAGLFRLNACFLSFTASDFSNQVLQDALSSLPRRALLVMEDVDVLFNEDRKSEVSPALTFSGMLNGMDGLVSTDGILTIYTTNHIEKLDPALIRGGRIDRRFEFVHPNHRHMCSLFLSFYENASKEVAERFADEVLNRPEEEARSIATLQQHFIFTRKYDAETSVKMLPQFFSEFYPRGAKTRNPLYL